MQIKQWFTLKINDTPHPVLLVHEAPLPPAVPTQLPPSEPQITPEQMMQALAQLTALKTVLSNLAACAADLQRKYDKAVETAGFYKTEAERYAQLHDSAMLCLVDVVRFADGKVEVPLTSTTRRPSVSSEIVDGVRVITLCENNALN